MSEDTPSSVSKARGEILDVITSTARTEWVVIGVAIQIDSASVRPDYACRLAVRRRFGALLGS